MPKTASEPLQSVIRDQLELLRLSLYVATQGPAEYQGEVLACTLPEAKQKTSQLMAMCAGQSVNTLLTCAHWQGIPVRDLYPIARSAVESFINAAYVLAEADSVAERAARWVRYRAWREVNRTVGSGAFTLRVSADGAEVPAEFVEFTDKGASREWATVDAASRVRRVGELAGHKAGGRLLAAYALIYAASSDVIHGTPFGANYFYQVFQSSGAATVNDFREGTGRHVAHILSATSHAVAGYLSAFFRLLGMSAPYLAEQEAFNRLLAAEGIEPQMVEHLSQGGC